MTLTNAEAFDQKFRKDLNAGISALIILIVLSQAEEPMYGYQIAKLIRQDDSSIKQGTLYPVLRTLESNGMLESNVEPSVSGPPRRYYRITQAGRETLTRWLRIWQQIKTLVDSTIDGGRQ